MRELKRKLKRRKKVMLRSLNYTSKSEKSQSISDRPRLTVIRLCPLSSCVHTPKPSRSGFKKKCLTWKLKRISRPPKCSGQSHNRPVKQARAWREGSHALAAVLVNEKRPGADESPRLHARVTATASPSVPAATGTTRLRHSSGF